MIESQWTAPGSALIVVDVQNDFCPGGALTVPGGDAIIPAVNRLIAASDLVVLTQDWHPKGHGSFASSHAGRQPFDSIDMPYGPQTLWPDHCVQGTSGAAFHAALEAIPAALVVRKGMRAAVDSYSAFFENDRRTPTGLDGWLRARGVERVVLCGLAYDFCVAYSALDSAALGFATMVVENACAAIDLNGSRTAQDNAMRVAGVDIQTVTF